MAIEVQNSMVERNAGLPPDRRIEFRIGIHLGNIVEESDGDQYEDRGYGDKLLVECTVTVIPCP